MSASALRGEGTNTVQISDHNGMVILHFEKPVPWVALDPETARRVAEVMAQAAYKVRFGDTPTPKTGSQLGDLLRLKLRNRVALMLKSMSGDQPIPPYEIQAERVVDECLKEAT